MGERGRLIRAYGYSFRLLERMVELVHAVFAGAWLGILRPAQFDAVDQRHHMQSIFARADYNRRGLFAWEERCLERFPPTGRILVIAAGGGREMLALARIGFALDGCDCNPVLVALAKKLLASVECSVTVAGRDGLVAPRPPYDAVVVGWGAYALMRGRVSRIRFLNSLRSVIRVDAPIMLSFPVRSARARAPRVSRTVANALRRLQFREPIELGDDLRGYAIHRFSRGEVDFEVRQAGFELELYDEKEYGHAVCRASIEAKV